MRLAELTHERLDGRGYHRRLPASACPLPARILAAADVYQALTEIRPHRAALSREEAERELRKQATEGKLASEAVDAVLAASGQVGGPRSYAAGLTARRVTAGRRSPRQFAT